MQFEDPIPDKGILEIHFPSGHYKSDLGLASTTSFPCYIEKEKPLACTVASSIITVPIGRQEADVDIAVTIEGVENPSHDGGNG
jgi:hypothetical protein